MKIFFNSDETQYKEIIADQKWKKLTFRQISSKPGTQVLIIKSSKHQQPFKNTQTPSGDNIKHKMPAKEHSRN